MWPYPWTHVGTPSHLGHMDRVAATMPSQAHAGVAQEAPNIGQWEGQDVPLVRPSSCTVKGGIPSSRRYLPTYLCVHSHLQVPISVDEVTCNACYILVSSLHKVAVQYDKLAVELHTRHKSGRPQPGCPTTIGTLRSLTFVGNEHLLGEVIFFLDPRALASTMMACRHLKL